MRFSKMLTIYDLPLVSKIDFSSSVYSYQISWLLQSVPRVSEKFETPLDGDRSLQWQMRISKGSDKNFTWVLRLINTPCDDKPHFVMGQFKLSETKYYRPNPLIFQPFHYIFDGQDTEIRFSIKGCSEIELQGQFIKMWLFIPAGTVQPTTKPRSALENQWSKKEPDSKEASNWITLKIVNAKNEVVDHLYCLQEFLTTNSPVFACMLYEDWWREGREKEIRISDMDAQIVEAMLIYMEDPKKIDLAIQDLQSLGDLLYAAEKYQLADLARECAYRIRGHPQADQVKAASYDMLGKIKILTTTADGHITGEVECHRRVLQYGCPALYARIQQDGTVDVGNMAESAVQAVIKYLYTRKLDPRLPLTVNILVQMIEFGQEYGCKQWKEEIAYFVIARAPEYMKDGHILYKKLLKMLQMASAKQLVQLEAFLAVQLMVDYHILARDLNKMTSPLVSKIRRAYFSLEGYQGFVSSSVDVKSV